MSIQITIGELDYDMIQITPGVLILRFRMTSIHCHGDLFYCIVTFFNVG